MIEKAHIDCPDCGWMCLLDTDSSEVGVFCQNPRCKDECGNYKRIKPRYQMVIPTREDT